MICRHVSAYIFICVAKRIIRYDRIRLQWVCVCVCDTALQSTSEQRESRFSDRYAVNPTPDTLLNHRHYFLILIINNTEK